MSITFQKLQKTGSNISYNGNNGISLNFLHLIIALTFQTQRADFLKPQLKLHCSFYVMLPLSDDENDHV